MKEYCSHRDCGRVGHITDRDGNIHCKRHGDRLPPYLRREPGKDHGHATAARLRPQQDQGAKFQKRRTT